jgi:exopolysaccharide biosynthesis polyprenyl glycosylphosphotransferase
MIRGRKTSLAFLLLDIGSVFAAFNAIAALRGLPVWQHPLLASLLIPGGLLIVALYLIDGYHLHNDMLSLDYSSQHIIAILSTLLITMMVTFAVIPSGYSLQQSRAVLALSFLVICPATLSYRRALYARYIHRRKSQGIIFLGDRPSAQSFVEECTLAGMSQTIFHADMDDGQQTPFSKILERLREGRINIEAIVFRESSRVVTPEMSQQLVDLYFSGVPTYTLELFHQVYWRKIPLYRLNQTWLFQEGFQIAREPVFERIKRISDILLSLAGLILFLPFLLLAAVAIFTEDRGPVLFRQVRIGKNRRPFHIFKLRTMRSSSEGSPYAEEGDKRITRIGRFLRASRLDEVPQLLNVIRGDMSLIGPRAEWDKLVADYESQIPCYHFRHLVRPGITGWAQVNYPYGANIGDTLRKLEYDLYYIRHFSFRLDASIVLKTLHVMLFGKGR